jgi:hypothetical protein
MNFRCIIWAIRSELVFNTVILSPFRLKSTSDSIGRWHRSVSLNLRTNRFHENFLIFPIPTIIQITNNNNLSLLAICTVVFGPSADRRLSLDHGCRQRD